MAPPIKEYPKMDTFRLEVDTALLMVLGGEVVLRPSAEELDVCV